MPDFDACPWFYGLAGGARRVTDIEAHCDANPTGMVCRTTWDPRPSGGEIVRRCAVGRTVQTSVIETTAEPDPPPAPSNK
jgi:hypothetical protein